MNRQAVEAVIKRIDAIVKISADLNAEFTEQPALRSWLGSYYAEAKDNVRRLKNELALMHAKLLDEARRKYQNERVNKDVLEAWIITHCSYQDVLKRLLDAQLVEDQLASGIEALQHKRDSLMSLGANLRKEMADTELRLLTQKR